MRRKIEEVLNLRSGNHLKSDEIFNKPEEVIFKFRAFLTITFQKESCPIVCPFCGQPVYIVGTKSQEFFFRHRHELGDCPIKTKGQFSQEEIDRMRYNGIKESAKHRRLKDFIHATLTADERFKDVEKEEVIKGAGLAKGWRKPDVSSLFQGTPLVWEI